MSTICSIRWRTVQQVRILLLRVYYIGCEATRGLCNDLGATQWAAHRLVPSTQNKDLIFILVNRPMATSANAAPINNSGKYTHW